MDHVVYLDSPAKELENLLAGKKTMIIRGAAGRKIPYGRVNVGDILYFINNNGEGLVKGQGRVKSVMNSDRLTPEDALNMIINHQNALQLTESQQKRWQDKRYLVLIEVEDIQPVEEFRIDKSQFGNMDDWLPVGKIEDVKFNIPFPCRNLCIRTFIPDFSPNRSLPGIPGDSLFPAAS